MTVDSPSASRLTNADGLLTYDYSKDFGPFNGRVWMNTAAQGPLPKVAAAAARKAIDDKIDPRRIVPDLFLSTAEALRLALARFLNATLDDVFLGNSATYGMHIVANGLRWREGDEILVVVGDYPACVYPWLPLRKRGVKVTAIRPRGRWIDADELVDHLTSKSRLFCTNWVNSFQGHALNIEALAKACHERGSLFVLNAAQGVGTLPLDVSVTDVDVIAGCGYKWMLGPYGTGFGWIAPQLHDLLEHDPSYWYAMASDEEGATEQATRHGFRADLEYAPRTDLPRAARFDVFNTPNFLNFIPWRASLEYMLAQGLENIYSHNMLLVRTLLEGISTDRYEIVSPENGSGVSTLVVIAHRERERTQKVHAGLVESGIDVTYRFGSLRISPHLHNTVEDVERVTAALARLA